MLQLQYRLFLLPQQHLRLPLFAMILQMTMPTPRARPNHVHFGTDTARPELKSAVHKHPNQLLRRHYANPQAKPNCVKSGKRKTKPPFVDTRTPTKTQTSEEDPHPNASKQPGATNTKQPTHLSTTQPTNQTRQKTRFCVSGYTAHAQPRCRNRTIIDGRAYGDVALA